MLKLMADVIALLASSVALASPVKGVFHDQLAVIVDAIRDNSFPNEEVILYYDVPCNMGEKCEPMINTTNQFVSAFVGLDYIENENAITQRCSRAPVAKSSCSFSMPTGYGLLIAQAIPGLEVRLKPQTYRQSTR